MGLNPDTGQLRAASRPWHDILGCVPPKLSPSCTRPDTTSKNKMRLAPHWLYNIRKGAGPADVLEQRDYRYWIKSRLFNPLCATHYNLIVTVLSFSLLVITDLWVRVRDTKRKLITILLFNRMVSELILFCTVTNGTPFRVTFALGVLLLHYLVGKYVR